MPALTYRRIVPVLLVTSLAANAALFWKDFGLLRKGYADFTIFYSAAQIVRSGDARHLYDLQTQFRSQRTIVPDVGIRQGALPYNHLPAEAMLFVPLTFLPYFTAYVTWVAIGLGMLVLSLWVLRRRLPSLGLPRLPVLVLLAMAFFPMFMNFFQGQDEALLVLLVVLAYVSLQRGSEFEAGLWFGLGCFRPQVVLPLALILVCTRKSRLAYGFMLSAAGLAVLSASVVGWNQFVFYPKYVLDLERNFGHGAIVPAAMPNLRGFVSEFFVDGHAAALVVTLCASLLLVAWVVRRVRSAERAGQLEIGFSAALLASVLVSYHALIYDLGTLFLAILLLYPRISSSRRVGLLQPPWQVLIPVACLFFAPLQMILWLRLGRLNWMTLPLLLWMWGMTKSVADSSTVAEAQ